MSLRFKLLFAASLLLAVPVAGYRYVVAMEQFLRGHQAQAALDSARTLALALADEAELLDLPPGSSAGTLFVHPIDRALQIDGYDGDWADLAITPQPSAVNLRAASDGQALFVLLKLHAHTPRGRSVSGLRLILEDAPAFRRAWLLDASVPGELGVHEVPPGAGLTHPAHLDARMQAATQGHGASSIYEIRIPLSVGISGLSFEILGPEARTPGLDGSRQGGSGDVDFRSDAALRGREIRARIPDSDTLQVRFAPRKLAARLASWTPAPGRRLRVIDAEARVVAQAGDVSSAAPRAGIGALLEQFVDSHADSPLTLAPVTLQLSGREVDSALAGTAAVSVRRVERGGPLLVSAAYPLGNDDTLLGALVLEESTSPAQALARRALLELFLAAGAAFALGVSALLVVSGRVVARLRVLRDHAAAAIDDSGRVLKPFHASSGNDEIGDLGRSFGAAIERLQGYQDYLEKLAQRLSHELRTPLTVIRSSLDNLAMSGPDPQQREVFIARAQHGVERLESIVRRMSEAARLEQAIADSECKPFDLGEMVRAMVPTYQQSWPDCRLELQVPATPCVIDGSPELLVQALDKLLSNARDFADPQTVIAIRVAASPTLEPGHVRLEVCNKGPRLPAGDPARLFESMNSLRQGAAHESAEAHLGIGLYVVRLVAEFHRGRTFAHDDPHTRTVCIGVQLPGHSSRP